MTDIKCQVNGTEFRLAVDAILLWKDGLILVRRKYPPFSGWWALPGGMVDINETVEEAIAREVFEETGVKCRIDGLIGVFSALDRDPRGRTITVCFECKALNEPLKKSDEALEVKVFPFSRLPKLAFDHENIVAEFLKKKEQTTHLYEA